MDNEKSKSETILKKRLICPNKNVECTFGNLSPFPASCLKDIRS